MTPLARTGYADTFARDNLPPAAHWPVIEFTTDRLKYPERLNAAAECPPHPDEHHHRDSDRAHEAKRLAHEDFDFEPGELQQSAQHVPSTMAISLEWNAPSA